MSLNSLSNDIIRRQIQRSAALRPAEDSRRRRPQRGRRPGGVEVYNVYADQKPNTANQVIELLTKFIPGEVIAFYIAAVAAAVSSSWDDGRLGNLYWITVVVTPLAFILFFFAKLAMAGPIPKLTRGEWILLGVRALFSTVAFAIWALAIPTNPFQAAVGGGQWVGVIAAAVTALLGASDMILSRVLERSGNIEPAPASGI